jgi:hypothetical protein
MNKKLDKCEWKKVKGWPVSIKYQAKKTSPITLKDYFAISILLTSYIGFIAWLIMILS